MRPHLFIITLQLAVVFFSPVLSSTSHAVGFHSSKDLVLKSYNRTLGQHQSNLCSSKERQQFEQLMKAYNLSNFYLPISGKVVDKAAIRQQLPLLKQKADWLIRLRNTLPSDKQIKSYRSQIRPLRNQINELLDFKKQYRLAFTSDKKSTLKRASAQAMARLSKDFYQLMNRIPFLLSFGYPADHFANRQAHQAAKLKKGKGNSASLFLKRKIFEDGALNKNRISKDIYLRTTLDTLALTLKNQYAFLPEQVRYDLEWALRLIDADLKRGRRHQVRKLDEWANRTSRAIEFYEGLLDTSKAAEVQALVDRKLIATDKLKQFVHSRQAKTYAYYSKQPEVIQALFAIDQVLLNEVGNATIQNYRDRRDVAQVVLNRKIHSKYSSMGSSDPVAQELAKLPKSPKPTSPWLNTLFRRGEFSFTLFFMPASYFSFCPDMFFVAKRARRKNLHLGIETLTKRDYKMLALRYFSRASMVGRIEMNRLWPDYVAIPERAGKAVASSKKLLKRLRANRYRYLYQFTDPDGVNFDVVEIRGTAYSIKGFPQKPEIFRHRDPNKFTYFLERTK